MKQRHYLLIAVAGIHTCILAWGAYRQSPTGDEVAHVVAGVNYLQFGKFDIYCVNPPLTRLVGAAPVVALGPKTDWKALSDELGTRSEFELGRDFIAANGKRAIRFYTIGRWACIPFSWLGAWICFRWARELYGQTAGALATSIWCFEPNILAHAQLVTPDLGATALGLAACYSFWKWLKDPVLWRASLAGLGLGLAELTKFTWLFLFLLWPIIWVAWSLMASDGRASARKWGAEGGVLFLLIFPIAIYVMNLGYGFEGSFRPLKESQFVSETLADVNIVRNEVGTTETTNRFTTSWLGDLPLPLPRDFVRGLDLQKADLEHFSRQSYLRGRFQDRGWWYFYLYGLAVKVPLGMWVLLLVSLCVRTPNALSEARDTVCLLAPGLGVLFLVSSHTGFSIHFRYILPSFPFFFIWVSRAGRLLSNDRPIAGKLTAAASAWLITSSMWIYPHCLSYFNELAGGPLNGHVHMLYSNIDWGQDLLFLRDWLADHPKARPLYLAYHGGFAPAAIGMDYPSPRLPSLTPRQPSTDLEPGYYAISLQYLCDFPFGRAPSGSMMIGSQRAEPFNTQPIARAGYSICIYRLPPRE